MGADATTRVGPGTGTRGHDTGEERAVAAYDGWSERPSPEVVDRTLRAAEAVRVLGPGLLAGWFSDPRSALRSASRLGRHPGPSAALAAALVVARAPGELGGLADRSDVADEHRTLAATLDGRVL